MSHALPISLSFIFYLIITRVRACVREKICVREECAEGNSESNKEEVTGEWGKFFSEELQPLYS